MVVSVLIVNKVAVFCFLTLCVSLLTTPLKNCTFVLTNVAICTTCPQLSDASPKLLVPIFFLTNLPQTKLLLGVI